MTTLLFPILVPLAVAIVALLVPARWGPLRTALGVAGALATAVLAIGIVPLRGTFAMEGFDIGPLALDVVLRADGFSCWAVAFSASMALLASLYSVGWFRDRGGAPGHHYAWILMATAGAGTVLLADQLLLLVVGWEIATLGLFMLAVSGRPEGSEGAAKAFVILGLGDLALLVGVVLIGLHNIDVGVAQPLAMDALRSAPLATASAMPAVAWLLLFVAAIAKAGAMPLHSWIPTMSTGSNSVVMAFLPGSLDKVLGIYLLVRVSLEWFTVTPTLRLVVMLVGVVTMLGAVFMAMVQHDLRRLLSYHAVSQVGYMLLGIGTGTVIGVIGGVFHMLNHAIYKACLFLGAGEVERETGTMELNRLGGLVRTFPITFGCMLVAALAISGIPPFNGFASKWLIYQSCVADGLPIFLVAALFGSVLTLASFVKVLHSVFFGPSPDWLDGAREDHSLGLRLPLVVLALLCIVLGVFPSIALDPYIGPVVGLEPDGAITASAAMAGDAATWGAVGAAAETARYQAAAFQPGVVTGLLVLGVLVALFVGYLGNLRWRRVRSVFIGGEAIDPNINRFPGTEFYRTVQTVPIVGRILAAGQRQRFDPYEVVLGLGRPVVRGLRRLHSGLATDYLAWCLLGTTVLFVVLMVGR